jgi:hypothetical protein
VYFEAGMLAASGYMSSLSKVFGGLNARYGRSDFSQYVR